METWWPHPSDPDEGRVAEVRSWKRKGMCMNLKGHGGFSSSSQAGEERRMGKKILGVPSRAGVPLGFMQEQREGSTRAQSRGAIGSDFSFARFTLAAIRIAREQHWGRGDHLGSCHNHPGQRMRPGAGR